MVLSAVSTPLLAQEEFHFRPPTDSAIIAARALVADGKFDEGREVLDSILGQNKPGTQMYSEALYWRGALAPTAADAERDYNRLLIEAPFAPRAEDAMLQLAQLQYARGDRRGAAEHLQQYLLTFPNDESRPARSRAALWYVRLQFELNETARGCEGVRIARDALANESIEMKNQLEYYVPRCAYVDVSSSSGDSAPAAPAEPAAAPKQSGAPSSASAERGDSARPSRGNRSGKPAPAAKSPKPAPAKSASAPAGRTFFSVQVAAYDSQEAARRMADGLVARGLAARVDGTSRPYRVRIGKFAVRADAVKLAQQLKAQGQNGFVTQVKQ